jgi:hypothetical protein
MTEQKKKTRKAKDNKKGDLDNRVEFARKVLATGRVSCANCTIVDCADHPSKILGMLGNE